MLCWQPGSYLVEEACDAEVGEDVEERPHQLLLGVGAAVAQEQRHVLGAGRGARDGAGVAARSLRRLVVLLVLGGRRPRQLAPHAGHQRGHQHARVAARAVDGGDWACNISVCILGVNRRGLVESVEH